MDLGESSLDNALKFDHIEPADYTAVAPGQSARWFRCCNSRARRASRPMPEFQKLNKEIATF